MLFVSACFFRTMLVAGLCIERIEDRSRRWSQSMFVADFEEARWEVPASKRTYVRPVVLWFFLGDFCCKSWIFWWGYKKYILEDLWWTQFACCYLPLIWSLPEAASQVRRFDWHNLPRVDTFIESTQETLLYWVVLNEFSWSCHQILWLQAGSEKQENIK